MAAQSPRIYDTCLCHSQKLVHAGCSMMIHTRDTNNFDVCPSIMMPHLHDFCPTLQRPGASVLWPKVWDRYQLAWQTYHIGMTLTEPELLKVIKGLEVSSPIPSKPFTPCASNHKHLAAYMSDACSLSVLSTWGNRFSTQPDRCDKVGRQHRINIVML